MNDGWWVGSNGNWFKDMAGFRYCVAYIARNSYDVYRSGELLNRNIPSETAAKLLADQDGRIMSDPR